MVIWKVEQSVRLFEFAAKLDKCIKVRTAISTWGEPAMFNMTFAKTFTFSEGVLVNSSKLDERNEMRVVIQTRVQAAMFNLTITITIFRTTLNI